MAIIPKNFIVDYSAVGDGVISETHTNDGPKLGDVQADALANPDDHYVLSFDRSGSPETYEMWGSEAQSWTQGIYNVTVEGEGSTWYVPPGSGQIVDFGFNYFTGTPNALIATASRGESTVTLLDHDDADLFEVGDWTCPAGLMVQPGGTPGNYNVFEFVQITDIDVAGAVVTLTFHRPLRNTYLSTWPDDGAAQLIVVPSGWGGTFTWNNLTIDQELGGHGRQRNLYLNDMTLPGIHGFTPTASEVTVLDRCNLPDASPECDKLISVLAIRDSEIERLIHQSATPDMLYVVDSELTSPGSPAAMQGQPKHTIMAGTSVGEWGIGVFYGSTKSIALTDCTVASWTTGGTPDVGGDVSTSPGGVDVECTITDGVIAVPRATRPDSQYLPWAIPGTVIFLGGGDVYKYCYPLEITGVTADVTNHYVHTSSSLDAWPTIPRYTSGDGRMVIWQHPCPSLTVNNVTGHWYGVDWSGAPDGAPLGSYSSRTFTKDEMTGSQQGQPVVFGRVVEVIVDVEVAHTGGALTAKIMDVPLLSDDNTTSARWEPVVNLAIAGVRTIRPGESPVEGAQTGDSLVMNGSWLTGVEYNGFQSLADISGTSSNVSVTVTIITDQEAVDVPDPGYAELIALAQGALGIASKTFACHFAA